MENGTSFSCFQVNVLLSSTYLRPKPIRYLIPEPAGRTYEELGIMFIRKVKARDFKKYHIDTLDINEIVQIDAKRIKNNKGEVIINQDS